MENFWIINVACALLCGYIATVTRTRLVMWLNIAAALISVAAVITHFA